MVLCTDKCPPPFAFTLLRLSLDDAGVCECAPRTLVSSERTIAVTDRYAGVVIIATLMMPPVPLLHISFLANRIRQMVNNMRQEASGWK
jgi:hypothetical protein